MPQAPRTLPLAALALALGCGSSQHEPPAPAPAPIVTILAGDASAPKPAPTPTPIRRAAVPAEPPVANPAVADRIELTFAGDIMFGGTFAGKYRPQEAPADFDPLAPIAAQLKSDLAVVNLETTVVKKIPIDKLVGDLRFAARPDQVATLLRNGVTAVTIANNHACDLDGPGVIETAVNLRELGITALGAARTEAPLVRIETMEVRGWKIGFIATTTWLNRSQAKRDPKVPRLKQAEFTSELVPLVKAARTNHDLVFVLVHWGTQYADDPDAWQVEAAHAIIDAGAAGVIGHHPHILHRIERYKDGVIAYSLGNFLFNNALPVQRNTAVLRLGFAGPSRCLDKVVLHPAAMYPSPVHHPKPVPASNRIFSEIVERTTRLSLKGKHPTKLTVEGDLIVAPPACP